MAAKVTRANLQIARLAMRAGVRQIKWHTKASPRDVFGRQYTVYLDRANLHPKGQFIRDFSEPLPVPDQYLAIHEGDPHTVHIDFDRWHDDEAAAMADWEYREEEARVKAYGDKGRRMEPDEASLKAAGPRPMPAVLVALMAAGDRWCLGLQKEPTAAVLAAVGGKGTEAHRRWVLGVAPAARGRNVSRGARIPAEIAKLMKQDGATVPRQQQRQAPARPNVPVVPSDDAPINPEG